MSKLAAAVDSSTSSTKLEVYDASGKAIFSEFKEHATICTNPGWSENDPEEIFSNLLDLMKKAKKDLASDQFSQIDCLGICNQRETVVAWRKSTSKCLYNAVLWCDGRTSTLCEDLIDQKNGDRDFFKKITGLPISPYFSAFKIAWLLKNSDEVKKAHDEDDLCIGNINTWILWKLTEGKKFLTDCSNASRTFLMDIQSLEYSEELLSQFGIKKTCLPEIKPTFDEFGLISLEDSCFSHIPICCMLGDQQSATIGHGLLLPGSVKNTYGTGAFLMANTGDKVILDCPGLVASVLYQEKGKSAVYCLEGAIECGANILNWMKNSMHIFEDFGTINEEIPKSTQGLYFLSAFQGLYSPFWEPKAQSLIYGCTLHTKPGHLFRAALEGIAYRTKDCIKELQKAVEIKDLLVDGGMTRSQFLLEFQQSILGIQVKKSDNPNCTVYGAAIGAACFHRQTPLADNPFAEKEETQLSGKWELEDEYEFWRELCQTSIQLSKKKNK